MTRFDSASAEDMAAIRTLLESSGLPTSDLAASQPVFAVFRGGGRVVATGALQRFGSFALLRSVVVADGHRGAGLGRAIVSELERLAQADHVEQVVLLTQTAAEFFARQGYRVIERGEVPATIQGSEEFRALCPSSAICMTKRLTAIGKTPAEPG